LLVCSRLVPIAVVDAIVVAVFADEARVHDRIDGTVDGDLRASGRSSRRQPQRLRAVVVHTGARCGRAPAPRCRDAQRMGRPGVSAAPHRALQAGDVLSAAEVSGMLHIPRSTVYDLARRGILPSVRLGGRRVFLRQRVEVVLWGDAGGESGG
jgi:excisionase family DNA binding protein